MSKHTVSLFDIETAPLPDEQLALVKPVFEAPANYKDPEKIAANIAEQEARWKEKAALDATTGQVLMIGVMQGGIFDAMTGTEKEILTRFWMWLDTMQLALSHTVAGFCIFHFDLPFLVRRSYVQDVKFPWTIKQGRYWSEHFIDLAEIWSCGNREQRVSLDTISKALGIGAKNGEGKNFAKLFAEDRDAAIAYCENDLRLTEQIAKRMGIIT